MKTIKLDANKTFRELSLLVSVENHSNNEDGVLMLMNGTQYLSEPIKLALLPNKFRLSEFLIELSDVDLDTVITEVNVVYHKGFKNGEWTIVFLEEADFEFQTELKTCILVPAIQAVFNTVKFKQPQPFKGIVMEINSTELFLNQTLECLFIVESHGVKAEQSVFIKINKTSFRYRFNGVLIGLNLNIDSIAFRLLTNGIQFTNDDEIHISFMEIY